MEFVLSDTISQLEFINLISFYNEIISYLLFFQLLELSELLVDRLMGNDDDTEEAIGGDVGQVYYNMVSIIFVY